MKLAVDRRFGLVAVEGETVRALNEALRVPEQHADPMLWALESGAFHAEIDRATFDASPTAPYDYAQLLAPITRPGKVIAAPVNYLDHQAEMREENTIANYGVFLKARTSIIGPNDKVLLPYSDKRTDQEGELGVVIGKGGRAISREDALSHVFGYVNLLDITVRSTEDRSTRKSYDTFTPIGPWVVTADEAGDPGRMDLRTEVSGVLRQQVNTKDLIFDVPLLIEYASSIMTLEPGDIIATGTPAGVGQIGDGDVIEVEIGNLGRLSVPVSAERAIPYADRPRVRVS